MNYTLRAAGGYAIFKSMKSTLHNKTLRGMLCALLGGILWGFSGTVGQYLFTFKSIDSQWLSSVRMLSAGVLLVTFAAIKNPSALKAVWRVPRDVARLAVFSILGLMTCQYTYLTAIAHANSATATALQYLGLALILLVSCVRLRRLPTYKENVTLVLAIIGIFLLATHGSLHQLVLSPQALFWGLAAAVALMLYTLLPGDLVARYGSVPMTGFAMLIGGSVLAVLTQVWTYSVQLDGGALLGIAAIVLLGTAGSFTLYLQGVSDIGAVRASLLACIEPVSAALTMTLWLKTPIAPLDWLGFGLILLMAVLLTWPKRQKAAMAAPESKKDRV